MKNFIRLFISLTIIAFGNANAAYINFDDLTVGSYDDVAPAFQDVTGTYALSDGGLTATITGNTWKIFSGGTFTIDPSTILHFLFSATANVDIAGIGFDNDAVATEQDILKVDGWQNYGTEVYNYTLGSGLVAISVPIGSLYTSGVYDSIFLIQDKDAGSVDMSLTFTNVELCSSGQSCVSTSVVSVNSPSTVLLFSFSLLFLRLLIRKI